MQVQFNYHAFVVVMVAGLIISVLTWLVLRDVSKSVEDPYKNVTETILEYTDELNRLNQKITDVQGQVEALRADVDILHDALIKELQEPPRRM